MTEDIACPFEASYVAEDDEFEEISTELDINEFDSDDLKDKIKSAVFEYED